jgi:cellulose biosynthesis protein BcsQ
MEDMGVGRLRMVVADTDEAYLVSLSGFFTNTCSRRFQVSSFTDKSSLDRYLSENNEKIDIILINKELFSEHLSINKGSTVIFLTEGNCNAGFEGCYSVNKYQHCERLAANIIKIYSENTYRDSVCSFGDKKSRITAVFSPAGGTGKTTVSLCASIQCANKGLPVFYLNLEDFQSTPLYFDCGSGPNFSNFLYYLKNKDKNLDLRIEGFSSFDDDSNVRFFSPPESAVEINELTPGELSRLINELHKSERYEAVFIDMSSRLDRRSLAVFEGSDVILLVITQDEACMLKVKRLVDELNMLMKKSNKSCIWDKVVIVLNRCIDNGRPNPLEDFKIEGIDPLIIKLPESKELQYFKGAAKFTGMNNPFNAGVSRLVSEFIIRGTGHGT